MSFVQLKSELEKVIYCKKLTSRGGALAPVPLYSCREPGDATNVRVQVTLSLSFLVPSLPVVPYRPLPSHEARTLPIQLRRSAR